MVTPRETFINNYRVLRNYDDSFSTDCPQKMWKIQKTCQVLFVLFLFVGLLFLTACRGTGVDQFKRLPRGATLIEKDEAEVRKALGEPNVISKTPENRVLWRYKPSWKVMPSDKDTLYVEFENGKVIRVFQIK
jgi:hypothetical protein